MRVSIAPWDPSAAAGVDDFAAVLELHKANRGTLGPMPDAAFRERTRHDGLLIAHLDDRVGAYMLYDVPRQSHVKIVHLCVAETSRGKGIAKALVSEAIRRHPGRSLITAACRADYGIDGLWRSLGMHAASERPGRALSGSVLVNWVKRINTDSGLDLFESAALHSGLPVAVLDTNVVCDLFSTPDVRRDHREESSALLADWLHGLVTFALSGEVDNEINQNDDAPQRINLRAASAHLTRLSTRRPDQRTTEDMLLDAVRPEVLKRDTSLYSDVLHVADAINSGADYFVSNDKTLIEVAASWNEAAPGLRVLRPHELVRVLAPDSSTPPFRSRLIDDSDLTWDPVLMLQSDFERQFRVLELEPKPSDFERVMRGLLSRPRDVELMHLTDRDGRSWALAAIEIVDGALRLPLLRATRGPRGGTVSSQLVRFFRRLAWDRGLARVDVTDPALSPAISAALQDDGFSANPPHTATLGPATISATELDAYAQTRVLEAERKRWPLVVLESGLPTYLVPIRPKWATWLLGLDDGLFSTRRRGLGLSRELVYFSGSTTLPQELPARVLWYSSADKGLQVSQIVARSVMVDAMRMPVDEAASRFGDYGVFRKTDIAASSDSKGLVNVIRFQDTEVLQRPVSRHEPIFKKYVKGQVQSMRSVDSRLFDEVMAEQRVEVPRT